MSCSPIVNQGKIAFKNKQITSGKAILSYKRSESVKRGRDRACYHIHT